jgi:hypothetical protein
LYFSSPVKATVEATAVGEEIKVEDIKEEIQEIMPQDPTVKAEPSVDKKISEQVG